MPQLHQDGSIFYCKMTDKINILQVNSSNSKFTTHQSHVRKLIDEQKAHVTILSESNHGDSTISEELITNQIFKETAYRINLQTIIE